MGNDNPLRSGYDLIQRILIWLRSLHIPISTLYCCYAHLHIHNNTDPFVVPMMKQNKCVVPRVTVSPFSEAVDLNGFKRSTVLPSIISVLPPSSIHPPLYVTINSSPVNFLIQPSPNMIKMPDVVSSIFVSANLNPNVSILSLLMEPQLASPG